MGDYIMPHLFHEKIIKQQQRRILQETKTLRDAVVIQLFEDDNYCLVNIQGTNTKVVAHYNQSWSSRPQWLTPGNAVRIETPQGGKGKIQISGHGFSMPVPIVGGDITPVPPSLPNAILTGMTPSASGTTMQLSVSIGTYRLNNLPYTFSILYMNDAAIIMNRNDIYLGIVGGSVDFDPAHATETRVDVVSVDANGALTVTKGTNATTDPVVPDTPTNQVFICWVLIDPTITAINSWNINGLWYTPTPVSMSLTDTSSPPTPTPFRLPWSTEVCNFKLKVLDKNDIPLVGSYTISADFVLAAVGNGTLYADGRTIVNGETLTVVTTNEIDYTYTRKTPAESTDASSPTFVFNELITGLTISKFIELEDSSGYVMF